MRRPIVIALLIGAAAWLGACGGGGGGGGTPSYTIGGTVSGLVSGQQVSLTNNGGDTLVVSANGAFTFKTAVVASGSYSVAVSNQPVGGQCVVSNSAGTNVSTNVTTITVACTPDTYTVSGTISNVAANQPVTLTDNGADALQISASGNFTFAAPIAYGSAYAVAVSAQPLGQTCTVSNGSGTMTGPVNNVTVACTPQPLLSPIPTLLPDLSAKYAALCGLLAHMQNAIPVDIYKTGRKSLFLNVWCLHTPAGDPYVGPVINTLIVLGQDQNGNFTDQTKAVLGSDMPSISGIGMKYVVYDANGDGYDDIVYAVDGEDGRSPAFVGPAVPFDQSASNLNFPTVALLSNGDGTYQITPFGQPVWGSDLRLISAKPNNPILVLLPADSSSQGWTYNQGWSAIGGYSWVSTFTNVFLDYTQTGVLPTVAVNGYKDSSVQNIQVWGQSGGVWNKQSDTNFLSYQYVPYADRTGAQSNLQIGNVFGSDYVVPFLYEGCQFNLSPTSPVVPLFSMLGGQIIGGYQPGQVLTDSVIQPGVDLVTFDISASNLPVNIRSLARVNLNGGYPYYRLVCDDINKDGNEDIVIQNLSTPIMFLNDGQGNLHFVQQGNFPPLPHGATYIYEDLDGDGIRDLLYFPIDRYQNWPVPSGEVRVVIYKGLRKLMLSDTQ